MTDENTVGRRIVQVVEILQPICENVYGSSPCTASGGDDVKCYNTRATCQDLANFAFDTTPLSLFFVHGNLDGQEISGANYTIPSLVSVSTSPSKINLAGSNLDAQGLGNRAACTITFRDHQHSDRVVDPYIDGRSWDALSADRGSFWARWVVRNKYRQNVQINVYEGYAGQAISEMVKRAYFLQSVSGPDTNGNFSIQGKDILARLEERKAQAPVASLGGLYTAMTDSQTSFTITGDVIGNWDASGTATIGNEIMTYASITDNLDGTLTFNTVERGTDNSTAEEHAVDDSVQLCLRYENEMIDDVLASWLGDAEFGNIPAAFLDTAGWATEIDRFLGGFPLTGLITKPTAVNKLVADLANQALFYVWWDERESLVKLKAIRGVTSIPPVINDESNIMTGLVMKEKPRQRVSQLDIFFGVNDFTGSQTSQKSYSRRYVEIDVDNFYGEPSIKIIYGNWINTFNTAQDVAARILLRYVDTPFECTFEMDAKDRGYWVGDAVKISHYLDVDQYGERQERTWTIVSADEIEAGHKVRYVAEDTTLYGEVNFYMNSIFPDFTAAPVAFGVSYMGDDDGILGDGITPAARYS